MILLPLFMTSSSILASYAFSGKLEYFDVWWCPLPTLKPLGAAAFCTFLPWHPNPIPWLLFQPHSPTPKPNSTYCFLCEFQVLGLSAWNVLSSQRCLLKSWSSGLFMKPLIVFPQFQASMFFLFLGLLWEEPGGLTWIPIPIYAFPWGMILGQLMFLEP